MTRTAQPSLTSIKAELRLITRGAQLDAFPRSREESVAISAAYLALGLEQGGICIYCASGAAWEEVRGSLVSGGVDVQQAERSGELFFLDLDESGWEDENIWQLIGRLVEGTESGRRASPWVLRDASLAGSDGGSILAACRTFGTRLMELSEKQAILLCQYPVNLSPGEVARIILEGHPLVFLEGTLCRNPFCSPQETGAALGEGEDTRWEGIVGAVLAHERLLRELADTHERYGVLLEGAELVAWDWDINARVVVRSEQFFSWTGYQKGEIKPTVEGLLELLHPEDLPSVRAALEAHLEGKTELFEAEYRIRRTDGEWLWLATRGKVLVRDPSGKPLRMSGAHFNITNLKRAEAALRRREAILEALGTQTRNLFLEPTWEQAVTALLEALGKAAEVCGVFVFENASGEDGSLWAQKRWAWHLCPTCAMGCPAIPDTLRFQEDGLARWAELLAGGAVVAGALHAFPEPERRYLQRLGNVSLALAPIFVRQSWWGFLGVQTQLAVRDWEPGEVAALRLAGQTLGAALEHRQNLEALAESDRRLREAQRVAKVGSWELDLVRNRLTWSDEVFRIFEIDPAGFGASYEAFLARVHPDDRAIVDRVYRESVETGRPYMVEHRLLMADGRVKYVVERGETAYDADGKPLRSYGTVLDITEHRKLEAELRHAQRIEALGRLAGGVAHDFNNLLQAMAALVGTLQGRGELNPTAQELVAELAEHIQRGARLARQLLVISRKDVTKPEYLDLRKVAEDVAGMLRRLIRENIRFFLEVSPEPCVVRGDRGQLEQVLLNLVVNASEAIAESGDIHVRIGKEKPKVFIEVRDTGSGIPDEILEHIFEPYFTTKSRSRGAGLGLAVVRAIVDQHGGSVDVESSPGVGTTFRIWLPEAEGEAVAEPEGEKAVRRGHGERILLVEDNEWVRRGLARALTEFGYQVEAVESAEAALTVSLNQPFDLLLSDLLLPGISGANLAAELAKRWPKLRVVLMSGYTEDVVAKLAIEAGNVRFLQKPFTLDSLAREVRACLDEDPLREHGGIASEKGDEREEERRH